MIFLRDAESTSPCIKSTVLSANATFIFSCRSLAVDVYSVNIKTLRPSLSMAPSSMIASLTASNFLSADARRMSSRIVRNASRSDAVSASMALTSYLFPVSSVATSSTICTNSTSASATPSTPSPSISLRLHRPNAALKSLTRSIRPFRSTFSTCSYMRILLSILVRTAAVLDSNRFRRITTWRCARTACFFFSSGVRALLYLSGA